MFVCLFVVKLNESFSGNVCVCVVLYLHAFNGYIYTCVHTSLHTWHVYIKHHRGMQYYLYHLVRLIIRVRYVYICMYVCMNKKDTRYASTHIILVGLYV